MISNSTIENKLNSKKELIKHIILDNIGDRIISLFYVFFQREFISY